MGLVETAIEYRNAGLSVIACNDKKPLTGLKWSKYREGQATDEDIQDWMKRADQIAVICGWISGSLEVIDVDIKYNPDPDFWDKFWADVCDAFDGQPPVTLTQTPSGGYHILYRAQNIEVGQKLAGRKNSNNVSEYFLETRGKGHYVIAAPSEGYTLLSGDYTNIPTLKNHQRDKLLDICRSYNEIYDCPPIEKKIRSTQSFKSTPWDEYNDDLDEPWRGVLIAAGWKMVGNRNGREYWKRPGSENSTSGNWHIEKRLFWVWSPNTPFQQEKAYTASAIHAMIQHDGDFSASAIALAKAGYGSQFSVKEHMIIELARGHSKTGISFADIEAKLSANYDEVDNIAQLVEQAKAPKFKITRTKDKLIDKTIEYIQKKKIVFNKVTKTVENEKWEELTEEETLTLWLSANQEGIKVKKDLFYSIMISNKTPHYHPFKDYFFNLETDTSTDAIDDIIDSLSLEGNENIDIKKSLIRKWMLQIPASAYNNAPLDKMLILTGPKFVGKTEFFARLLPKRLQNYYDVSELRDDKDMYTLYCSKLLILNDELKGLNKASIEHLKSLLSKKSFTFRMPYGRTTHSHPRYAVLAGASNPKQVIKNDQDNRRFIPIEITSRNFELYDSVDKDRLMVQLNTFYKKNGPSCLNLSEEELNFLKDGIHDFVEVNAYQELIKQYFVPGDKDQYLTTTQIFNKIMDHAPKQKINVIRLGRELRAMDYDPRKKKINGSSTRCYNIHFREDEFNIDIDADADVDMNAEPVIPSSGDLPF